MATISQRISLEGSEDILKKLEEIGKIGAAAFEQIKSAAEKMRVDTQINKTAEAADGLVTAGSELVKQFDALAEAASQTDKELKQVGDVADKVGEGLGKIAEDGAKAAEAITAVGDASKQASTEVVKSGDAAQKSSTSYVELGLSAVRTGAAVVQAGAGVSQAGTVVASLGVQTIGAAAAVGTLAISIGNVLVGAIGVAVGAIGLLGEALASIASSDAKLSAALDRTAQKTQQIGQGFTQLQVGQAAFEQIGISAEKFRSVISNIAEELRSFNAFKAITESIDKIPEAAQKALEAEKKLLEKQIELAKTDLSLPISGLGFRLEKVQKQIEGLKKDTTLADLQKEAIDLQEENAKAVANNLKTIFKLMKQIEGGQKAIEFDPLVTDETKIAAVKLRLNEVAKTGGDVSQTILNIIANLNSLDAGVVGKKLGFSETDIDRIQRYGAEIFKAGIGVSKFNDMMDKIRGAGVLISPDAAATFDKMANSSQRLDSAWARLKQAWSSTFFSTLAASGAAAFQNMLASILEFTASGLEAFNWLVGQVATLLGKIASGWGTIFSMIVRGWANIGRFIARAVTTAPGSTWAWIKDTFFSVVDTVLTKAGEAKEWIASWVTTPKGGAWEWLKSTFFAAVDAMGNRWWQFLQYIGRNQPRVDLQQDPGLFSKIVQGWGIIFSEIGQGWVIIGKAIANVVTTAASGAWQWIVDTFTSAVGLVIARAGETKSFIDTWVVTPAGGAWDWLKSTFWTACDGIVQQIQQTRPFIERFVTTPVAGAWQWIVDMWNAMRAKLGFGGGAAAPADVPGNARGGLLGGRGTGTSDSNLAWVSRGEHIMPARAVSQPGVLAFLEALRRSGGNLRDVLDGMRGFALGGLVAPTLSIPAFAGGGAMNHVTIQFPGLPEITGLRASSAVVDELRKAAAMAQVRSGGRKPSRYS